MGISRNQRLFRTDDLGSTKSTVILSLSQIEDVLIKWAGEFIKDAQFNLDAKDAVSTGELSESMKFNVSSFGNIYSLEIRMADYYDFINKGVRGLDSQAKAPNSPYSFRYYGVSKSFREALRKWIRQEGLKSRIRKEAVVTENVYNRKAKIELEAVSDEMSLANRIGRTLKKKGIKTTSFFDDALSDNRVTLNRELSRALRGNVEATIIREFYVDNG